MQCIANPLPLLEGFEAIIECGPTTAAAVINCAYPTYAQYRSGLRNLSPYHEKHLNDILTAIEFIAEGRRRAYLEEITNGRAI